MAEGGSMPSNANGSRLIITAILLQAATLSCSLAAIGQDQITGADQMSNNLLVSLEQIVTEMHWLPSKLFADPLTWAITAVVQMMLVIVIMLRISFIFRITQRRLSMADFLPPDITDNCIANDSPGTLVPPQGLRPSTTLGLKPQRDMRLPPRPENSLS
jgi:hypothetical protein